VEDRVVASDELGCEEAGQASHLHHMSAPLLGLDRRFLHLQSVKLALSLQSQGLKLEDLLSDDSVFEELRLIDKGVANFIHGNALAVGSGRLFGRLFLGSFFALSFFFFLSFGFCGFRSGSRFSSEWQIDLYLFQNSCNS